MPPSRAASLMVRQRLQIAEALMSSNIPAAACRARAMARKAPRVSSTPLSFLAGDSGVIASHFAPECRRFRGFSAAFAA